LFKNNAIRVLPGLLILVLLSAVSAFAQTKLLRFPDIHGDRAAFTYAGDIWTAPAEGGSAIRLTAHPGVEVFAKFSPDGKWIAFTGQYDGDEQVYVIPSTGGVPRQLTFYPAKGPLAPRWGWDRFLCRGQPLPTRKDNGSSKAMASFRTSKWTTIRSPKSKAAIRSWNAE
jgi:dipeptidyl aminopeptidase/acylaminoacyl peptidase